MRERLSPAFLEALDGLSGPSCSTARILTELNYEYLRLVVRLDELTDEERQRVDEIERLVYDLAWSIEDDDREARLDYVRIFVTIKYHFILLPETRNRYH